MRTDWLMAAAIAMALCGCGSDRTARESGPRGGAAPAGVAAEAGETKVRLDQTPAPVRRTIEKELAGNQLEDIALKRRDGRAVYETDIIKSDGKWEVVVAEDGSIVSNAREGSAEEQAADRKEEGEGGGAKSAADGFRDRFDAKKSNLAATGDNRYFPIKPGTVLKLRHENDSLTMTILPQTRTVAGVACGVLEERETKDGKLIEVSRNFFATDKTTGDVYYFGEEVDNYKDGKVVNHDSAWLAGRNGARFGLMIPGTPKVGDKFYQEIAPKVALDRVEVVSTDETVKTPAGTFEHCVHLKETTPLEPDVSHKYFAPGIGMIKDDEFELAARP